MANFTLWPYCIDAYLNHACCFETTDFVEVYWTLDKPMASLSTCHLGLWLGWQILLNLNLVAGFRNASPPDLNLFGYAFNPFNLYRTGVPAITMYNPHNPWPKTAVRPFPSWRGPRGYYGYYHEELDIHHNDGYRFPRDPKILVNDEDIMKYEYMRNMPMVHHKLPVEFPVLQ